jgi:NADPH2:quinone reductase
VGKFGVQWAKVAGIGTITAVASLSHEEDLKGMGATHVIDRHSATIVQDIQTIAGDKDALTHIYDCVNWTVSHPAILVLWSALLQHSSFPGRLLILMPSKYE